MAYKRILTIQDISCLGQCSATVALPVLSACGLETCILPTALLSTHTGGFEKPAITGLSQSAAAICRHWKEQNLVFDAIYTGYLGSIDAIRVTQKAIAELLVPGGAVIVDPAMADHGRLYSGFDEEYVRAMSQLCRDADMVIPNITEAAMLSGLPYEEKLTEDYIEKLLVGMNHPCVILTGAATDEAKTGVSIFRDGKRYDYRHRKIGRSYHGTGDLFASAFTGAFLQGKELPEAARIGADTVCLAIENTVPHPEHWYGVRFETAIPWLTQQLF